MKFLSWKDRTALEFIEAMFWYLINVRDDTTPEILTEMVEKAISSKDAGGLIMTVAEQLKEQGKKEGLKKGLEKRLEERMEKGELVG